MALFMPLMFTKQAHTKQLYPKTIEGVNTLLGPIAISLLHHLKAIGSLLKI
jgi:hypothetical protein